MTLDAGGELPAGTLHLGGVALDVGSSTYSAVDKTHVWSGVDDLRWQYGDRVYVRFDAGAAPSAAPASPTDLSATINRNGSVTLRWTAPDDASVTGYQVLRRKPSYERSLTVYVDDPGATGTTFTDHATAESTRYVYRVKARNAAGLSGWSNWARVDK